jgi:hypothetical protein
VTQTEPPASDGVGRPQGDFTGEPVSADDNDVADLELGQGEHAGGSAHTTQTDTGPSVASAGFGALGRALASHADGGDAEQTAALSSVVATVGENLGQEIGGGRGFSDFGSDLSGNAQSTATGLVASELTGELGAFEGTGFGDQLGARLTNYGVSSAINAGVEAATTGADFGGALDSSVNASSLGSVAGGFVGGYLSNEFLDEAGYSADTQTGATVGAVGSAVGTSVGAVQLGATIGSVVPGLGTAIGAFAGAVVGTVLGSELGDLFGSEPPPPPEAEAALSLDAAQGEFAVTSADEAHGGNAGGMAEAAHQAGQMIEGLVEATGGRLLNPGSIDDLTIGYDGDGLYVGGQSVDSVSEGLGVMMREVLGEHAIEGGDVYVKRALYQQLEGGGGVDVTAVQQAMQTAEQYSQLQDQLPKLERLESDPEVQQQLAALEAGEISPDELSEQAAFVHNAHQLQQKAEELGVTEAHRFDEASRLNDAFEANNIDLADVSLDELVIDQQQGAFIVAVQDREHPDAPVRQLPHASIDAYAGDFGSAMLYLGGSGYNLQALAERLDIDATSGAVDVGEALTQAYAEDGEAARLGSAGGDRLTGEAGIDTLSGNAGEDRLQARASEEAGNRVARPGRMPPDLRGRAANDAGLRRCRSIGLFVGHVLQTLLHRPTKNNGGR